LPAVVAGTTVFSSSVVVETDVPYINNCSIIISNNIDIRKNIEKLRVLSKK
jgi:hypothetical protein